MDKIKENPFWAAIIGALVLLLILAGVLIFPAWSEAGDLETAVQNHQMTLNQAAMDTPGTPDIRDWNDDVLAPDPKDEKDYYGKLAASYLKVIEHYARYDYNLEWWMTDGEPFDPKKAKPDQLAKVGKLPAQGTFTSRLGDAIKSLQDKLQKKGVSIGLQDDPGEQYNFGFNWEENINWGEIKDRKEETAILKQLQKRYWIRLRIANVCTEADVRVLRVADVHFFRRLSDKFTGQLTWEQRPQDQPDKNIYAIDYLADPTKAKGSSRERFVEFDLPGDLGKTISFGVTVDLLYTEVPKFIRKLLDLGDAKLQPQLLLNLVGARVLTLSQNRPSDRFEFEWHETDDEATNHKRKAEAEAKFYRDQKPVPVRLHLTCQVLDYDGAKLPEWAKTRLPEWAKPQPESE